MMNHPCKEVYLQAEMSPPPEDVPTLFLDTLFAYAKQAAVTWSEWKSLYDRMQERFRLGMERYRRPLTTYNGRDSLQDAWEECADLCLYLQQAVAEGRVKEYYLLRAVSLLHDLTVTEP
jgi:hypothetical protein